MERIIETNISRTAELTCIPQAASYFKKNSYYKSNDYISTKLIPIFLNPFLRLGTIRNLYRKKFTPKSVYITLLNLILYSA